VAINPVDCAGWRRAGNAIKTGVELSRFSRIERSFVRVVEFLAHSSDPRSRSGPPHCSTPRSTICRKLGGQRNRSRHLDRGGLPAHWPSRRRFAVADLQSQLPQLRSSERGSGCGRLIWRIERWRRTLGLGEGSSGQLPGLAAWVTTTFSVLGDAGQSATANPHWRTALAPGLYRPRRIVHQQIERSPRGLHRNDRATEAAVQPTGAAPRSSAAQASSRFKLAGFVYPGYRRPLLHKGRCGAALGLHQIRGGPAIVTLPPGW